MFRHLRSDRGGGATHPLGVSKRSVVELSGKDQQIAFAEKVLAIGGIIFGSRSICDPVMTGQRSNFRKFYDFLTLQVHISKTTYCSGMGPSPACSPLNSTQNEVFWCISVEYLGRIVLIDDAVSHRWRHRSELWRHGSVTWHANIIGYLPWTHKRQKNPSNRIYHLKKRL